jgi:hypothetical protein
MEALADGLEADSLWNRRWKVPEISALGREEFGGAETTKTFQLLRHVTRFGCLAEKEALHGVCNRGERPAAFEFR